MYIVLITWFITFKYDLIIRNGTIIDGTGRKSYKADIGIIDDQIAKIGCINEEAFNALDEEEKRQMRHHLSSLLICLSQLQLADPQPALVKLFGKRATQEKQI